VAAVRSPAHAHVSLPERMATYATNGRLEPWRRNFLARFVARRSGSSVSAAASAILSQVRTRGLFGCDDQVWSDEVAASCPVGEACRLGDELAAEASDGMNALKGPQ
jgi:hypothetical protein